MKGKHAKNTANKQKLAKRMLALCFAVVFLCSCVLPVFASGSSLLTDALREAVEETAASTDASTEAGGGTMMDSFQTMVSSYTTEYKTTYRFWLSEKDSYYLPDAATTSASDLALHNDFYAVAAIENNTTLTAPEGFKNPTDPTGEGRTFEGWYYIDTYGVTQTFTFDGSPVLLDKSATIDVFAKWGEAPAADPADDADKAEGSTEGAATAKPSKAPAKKADTYKEWYQNLKNTSDESTLDELATEYFKDSGFYSYLGSLPEEEQKELWEKLEPVNMPKVDEADLEETTDADETSEEGIMLLDISAPVNKISVGKKLILTSDRKAHQGYWVYWQADHSWTTSNSNVAKVESGKNYQTEKAIVTGVAAGTATITHTVTWWYYNADRKRVDSNTESDSYDVTVVKETLGTNAPAAVFLLKTPISDPTSNETSEWAPNGGAIRWIGEVNVHGALWENNKNINSYAAQHVTKWPDGTTDSVWTLKKTDTAHFGDSGKTYFEDVRDMIFDQYKNSIEEEIGKNNPTLKGEIKLTKNDITQIKVMPFKISRYNSSDPDMHIDCTIAVVNDKVYTATFWVMKPGDTKYTQVDARTYLKEQKVEKTTAAMIGDTTTVDGIKYTLKGWYKENSPYTTGSNAGAASDAGAASNERIADYEWNYEPSSTELADGTVNFYAMYVPESDVVEDRPYITVDKQVTGVSYDDLPSDFGILVDGQTYLKSAATEIDGTDDRNFTLRWKIDANAGDHTVGEQNYTVDGYDVEAKVNGTSLLESGSTPVTVKAADIKVQKVDVYPSCSNQDFLVQATATQETILVVALRTQNQKTNLVISQNPLSASVREALKNQLTSVLTSSDWDNDKTAFYSIADHGDRFVIANTIITYNKGTHMIHIGKTNNWTKAATLRWTKTGGVNPEVTITNSYTSNRADLTVTKTVTGNMADLDEVFTFQMAIDGTYDPEKITYKKGTDEGKLSELTDNKFTLKNGERIVFSGIPKDAVVTVTETGAEDYKTTVVVNDTPTAEAVALAAETGSVNNKTGSVTISADAKTIAFTNTKEIPVNTGVILDTLPYVLMLIAVGGGVVAFFLRRRHHDDEE